MALEKACFRVLNDCSTDTVKLKQDEKIYVQFNPEKYSINSSLQYSFARHNGKVFGQYTRTEPRTVSLDFFYDMLLDSNIYKNSLLSETAADESNLAIAGELPQAEAVNTAYVNKIVALTKTGKEKSAPPMVEFIWGNESIKGVITSISLQYVMFNLKGEPTRAHVKLSLRECDDVGKPDDTSPIVASTALPSGLSGTTGSRQRQSEADDAKRNAEVKKALVEAIKLL